MKNTLELSSNRIQRLLPRMMLFLICLQPILDIVSYWQTTLQIPVSLSFLPRAIVFVFLFLGGLILSDNKKVYWMMLGTISVFWAAHIAVCWQNGMTVRTFINDTAYFIGVLQLPITAVSMITCLKRTGEEGLEALLRGFFCTMAILLASFVISNVTGTEPHTYADRKAGICGYCFWPNAQSAILSMCAPMSIAYVMRKRPENTLLCILTMVLCLVILYLHGTRLSFLCMLLTGVGMAIVMILTKQKRRYVITIMAVVALFAGLIYLSPMFANRSFVTSYTQKKATVSERLLELGALQIRNGSSPVLVEEGIIEQKTGMQAFALTQPLQEPTFSDMDRVQEQAPVTTVENQLPVEEQAQYDEAYLPYVAYAQTLELVTSADKLYNYYPLATVHVVDLMCAADRIYEKYTGTQALTDWQDAGENWHDVFIRRSKLYGFDGKMIYQDNPWSICTRAQAAEVLYRALPVSEYPQVRELDTVPGMDEAAPYYEAVLALYRAGVINDLSDGEAFCPTEPINRLSCAAWIAAAVNPEFRLCDAGYSLTLPEKLPTVDADTLDAEVLSDATLYPLYNYFLYGSVDRFGIRAVAEEYDRSTDPGVIVDERAWKLHFCYLLMDNSTPLSRLFGLEADRMVYKGFSYDAENDIHAIYLRFGWVGIVLMGAFLLYFAALILIALIKRPKQIFTLEAGAIGIALIAVLAHAYYTCGVLRRANTLYYFGVLLAGAYYLVKLKRYPAIEDKQSAKRQLFHRKKDAKE